MGGGEGEYNSLKKKDYVGRDQTLVISAFIEEWE